MTFLSWIYTYLLINISNMEFFFKVDNYYFAGVVFLWDLTGVD
jgi:hypothetical protein